MAYFGGASRLAGDPGLFDTFRKVARAGLSFLPGASLAGSAAQFFQQPSRRFPIPLRGGGRGPGAVTVGADGIVRRKRRKMNMGNIKALKRAMRRQDGFVKVAKKALKGSNFVVVSRASQATARAKSKAIADAHHAG